MDGYVAGQLRKVLEDGPDVSEHFFRLKVTGNHETRWMNISPEELRAIIDIFEAQ